MGYKEGACLRTHNRVLRDGSIGKVIALQHKNLSSDLQDLHNELGTVVKGCYRIDLAGVHWAARRVKQHTLGSVRPHL